MELVNHGIFHLPTSFTEIFSFPSHENEDLLQQAICGLTPVRFHQIHPTRSSPFGTKKLEERSGLFDATSFTMLIDE